MARCKHCGIVSVDEALACELGDCTITAWHVPVNKKQRSAKAKKKKLKPKKDDDKRP